MPFLVSDQRDVLEKDKYPYYQKKLIKLPQHLRDVKRMQEAKTHVKERNDIVLVGYCFTALVAQCLVISNHNQGLFLITMSSRNSSG